MNAIQSRSIAHRHASTRYLTTPATTRSHQQYLKVGTWYTRGASLTILWLAARASSTGAAEDGIEPALSPPTRRRLAGDIVEDGSCSLTSATTGTSALLAAVDEADEDDGEGGAVDAEKKNKSKRKGCVSLWRKALQIPPSD